MDMPLLLCLTYVGYYLFVLFVAKRYGMLKSQHLMIQWADINWYQVLIQNMMTVALCSKKLIS